MRNDTPTENSYLLQEPLPLPRNAHPAAVHIVVGRRPRRRAPPTPPAVGLRTVGGPGGPHGPLELRDLGA